LHFLRSHLAQKRHRFLTSSFDGRQPASKHNWGNRGQTSLKERIHWTHWEPTTDCKHRWVWVKNLRQDPVRTNNKLPLPHRSQRLSVISYWWLLIQILPGLVWFSVHVGTLVTVMVDRKER
jgi:hypothetical protein